jgi:phosphocarrier protein
MEQGEQKLHKDTIIVNELGLHARSAAQIAEIAKYSSGNIWVVKDNLKADASSIMDILTLVCEKGTKIRIIIEDSEDTDILDDIVNLVDKGFGE